MAARWENLAKAAENMAAIVGDAIDEMVGETKADRDSLRRQTDELFEAALQDPEQAMGLLAWLETKGYSTDDVAVYLAGREERRTHGNHA